MGIMAGVIFFFSAASFWWTSQPSFCGRCHVMTPYIRRGASPHAMNCESCHLTPGFFGFVGGKIAGLQVVANYIRGDYEDWSNAAVSNVSCLQCHEEIMAKNITTTSPGWLAISASSRWAAVHELPLTSPTAKRWPSGGDSSDDGHLPKCHNDETAPLDCDLCHTGKRQVARCSPSTRRPHRTRG
jgi:hypothetical protein